MKIENSAVAVGGERVLHRLDVGLNVVALCSRQVGGFGVGDDDLRHAARDVASRAKAELVGVGRIEFYKVATGDVGGGTGPEWTDINAQRVDFDFFGEHVDACVIGDVGLGIRI